MPPVVDQPSPCGEPDPGELWLATRDSNHAFTIWLQSRDAAIVQADLSASFAGDELDLYREEQKRIRKREISRAWREKERQSKLEKS